MDADAETHLLTSGSIGVLLRYGVLHRDCTLHGVDGTREVGQNAVARRVEYPPSMRGDQAIYDGPVSRERAQRADLIAAHEAAVTFDIRCDDRRELSFNPVGFQGSAPPQPGV